MAKRSYTSKRMKELADKANGEVNMKVEREDGEVFYAKMEEEYTVEDMVRVVENRYGKVEVSMSSKKFLAVVFEDGTPHNFKFNKYLG